MKDTDTKPFDKSDLLFATNLGRLQAVHQLMSHRLARRAVNETNFYGQSALMLAAKKGYLEIANTLLEHGANPLLRDIYGRDAISYARENRHFALVTLLIRHLRGSTNAMR